ncbi:FAD-binding oxidoreductase [Devosia marina]|uniref:FAD-binding protein n=1 Tax=Devosia marina TaxID=2683198 RepID=A0A7X3FNN1_9HYPH|nr:FAD-binding oxidoreductase [Devosia marina]MVS97919.1 FAD-binding protein [Devosia marina]
MTGYWTRLDYNSWGRTISVPHEVASPRFPDEIAGLLSDNSGHTTLPVGLRRSYGDSNLNPNERLIDMTGLDRLIEFDRSTGILRCEAGISLHQLNQILVPSGWFMPTTPGTRFVTLGGAIANDVHGKNHHSAGSIGCAVRALTLARSDGTLQPIRSGDPLFLATLGGMGLTGVIVDAEIQLSRIGSAWLENERIAFSSVGDFFKLAHESTAFEHTVAWIDCAAQGPKLGRGVFQRANWCNDGEYAAPKKGAEPSLPLDFPQWALNRHSIRVFNNFYNWMQTRGSAVRREHYQPFFYPLDSLRNWNRMYGAAGFYQYQCVIPTEAAKEAVTRLLQTISASGQGSFLAVLKTLGGKSSGGMLSFPMEGATMALDFANRGAKTLHLMAQLDVIVAQADGRLYPAKDGRMPARMFRAGYPLWREFATFKDPKIQSSFWERVSKS